MGERKLDRLTWKPSIPAKAAAFRGKAYLALEFGTHNLIAYLPASARALCEPCNLPYDV
jgi:hypothetical protein